MLSRVYIKPFDVNLSTNILIYNSIITSHWYLTACCWLCATMVALVFWIACTRRGCRCWHFHWCKVIKTTPDSKIHGAHLGPLGPSWAPCIGLMNLFIWDIMFNWNMKSRTVTRVLMWLLCEYGVEASKNWVFVAHFIHLLNTTDAVHGR